VLYNLKTKRNYR